MLRNEDGKNIPSAAPIDSLDDLFTWSREDDYYVGIAPLEPCQRDELLPKTLVCHDMAGGYLEDRFVQGSGKYDAYRFYHWHLVDTFVYFSHHMITIPPPCWINAAHKHGVPVLGTFITEWDDGFKICDTLLSDLSLIQCAVDKMVDIAVHYSMDGWLINIENKINYERISNLVMFVKMLTQKMHEAKPGSQVIWYDSVTIDGELKWQNELNELNSIFFDVCDAIFLNYTWKNENLINSARNCNGRLQDVFVGIDVFGRGMIGGGGYNTKEALALARKAHLSIALFAPGWVYEVNGSREFDANEESLPLSSSFCQGWGKRTYMYGQAVSNEPWSNLSMQQPQPTLTHSEMGHNPHQQYKWLHLDDGFLGGGSMRFVGRLPGTGKPLTYRIFDTAIDVEDSLFVKYTIKRMAMEEGAKLCLYLIFNKGGDDEFRVLLPEDIKQLDYPDSESDTVVNSLPLADIPGALQSPPGARELNKWQSRVFKLDISLIREKSMDEIGLLAYNTKNENLMLNVLLGSVQVLSCNDPTMWPKPVNKVCDEIISHHCDINRRSLSLKLVWDEPTILSTVSAYHIWCSVDGGERVWLGCTYTNKFFIADLPLQDESRVILFTVQVQYKSGVLQDLNESAIYTLVL